MPNKEPDFSMEGVEEEYSLYLKDGDGFIDDLKAAMAAGKLEGVELEAYDEYDKDYFLECWGFKVEDRYGINRLYLFLHDTEDENEKRSCLYYLAKNDDGVYMIMQERDDAMFDKLVEIFSGSGDKVEDDVVEEAEPEKKKGKGWKIFLTIIFIPFWLVWQFIKALLSLFNIAVGDSETVKAFKRGFNGDSAPVREYSFINDMGCEETVYSSDGREFYHSDGSYAGSSDDFGKHINPKD